MREDDPRYTRSREALVRGITDLLEERALAEVTVKELVETSGVSRPTFYQHYNGDLGALAVDAALERLCGMFPDEGADTRPVDPDDERSRLPELIEPVVETFVTHLHESRDFYTRVIVGTSTLDLQRETIAMLTQQLMEVSPLRHWNRVVSADRVNIITGGIIWHIITWLTSPTEERTDLDTLTSTLVRELVAMVDVPALR